MSNTSKIATPIVIAVIGMAFLIFGLTANQNAFFNLAAAAITIGGIIGTMSAVSAFSKTVRYVVSGALVVMWVALAAMDYKSIQDELEFREVKKKRYEYVVQNLKDLRQAQLGYKDAYGKYASSLDTLVDFLKNDSITVIKAIGFVPDTLTEQKAIEMGIVTRDTIYEPAEQNIFTEDYMKERFKRQKLVLDSLPYIPFSGGARFELESGEIERNNLMVQVFQVTAPKEKILRGQNKRLTKLENDLVVGSMNEPTTSGNWGE